MEKFDLLIRCEGAKDLLVVDLTQEKDGNKVIMSCVDAIQALLASRGRRSSVEHYGGGFSLEIRRQEAADA